MIRKMCTMLLACACVSMAAKCTGYYFSENTAVYDGAAQARQVFTISRGDIALPYPTEDVRTISFGKPDVSANSISLSQRMFNIRGCACTTEVADEKMVRVMYMAKGEWSDGWVERAKAQAFVYEPTFFFQDFGKAYLLDLTSALKGLSHYLEHQAFKNLEPPKIINALAFRNSYDEVWNAIIQVFADMNIPIDIVDRESGLIITKHFTVMQENAKLCATEQTESSSALLNVFVKGYSSSVSVRINTTFYALHMDSPVTCYSTGTIEKGVFDKISVILPKAPPSRRPEQPAKQQPTAGAEAQQSKEKQHDKTESTSKEK